MLNHASLYKNIKIKNTEMCIKILKNSPVEFNSKALLLCDYDMVKSLLNLIPNYSILSYDLNHITDFSIIDLLIRSNKVNYNWNDHAVLRFVIKNNWNALTEYLLTKDIDPSVRNNKAIIYASHNGNYKIVKLLLKDERVDPTVYNNEILNYSEAFGNYLVINEILKWYANKYTTCTDKLEYQYASDETKKLILSRKKEKIIYAINNWKNK